MHQLLIVVQVLVAIGLIGIVLIQHGKGADAGAAFGSGGSGSVFGARGPASALTRITAGLAVAFFVNSVALAYVATQESAGMRSVVETAQPFELDSAIEDAITRSEDAEAGVPAAAGSDVPAPANAGDAAAADDGAVPAPASQ